METTVKKTESQKTCSWKQCSDGRKNDWMTPNTAWKQSEGAAMNGSRSWQE
jgi:hypothetical protein